MKPGIQTTEFWMTLVPQIATILVVVGVLPSEDVDGVTKMIAGVIAGIVSLVSLVAYVWSRVQLKKEALRIEGTKV